VTTLEAINSPQVAALARKYSRPASFAESKLGMNLYPKQAEALDAFFPLNCKISFASCNEGGKTRLVEVAAILWHLFMFPKGIVDATSGVYPQLLAQLLPGLHMYKHKFPEWTWYETPNIKTNKGGFLRGFTTNKPGYAEGDHSTGPEGPLAFLVDECKSAQPWLAAVVEGRIRPDRLMLLSSHGFAEGWFFESQTTYKHQFKCIVQRAEDCPHIKPETIKAVREKWGRSGLADSILGHGFMALVENAVIDYKQVDVAINNPPEWKAGEVHAFCDFAWSNDGDESVLCLRNGNKVTLEATFRAEGLHAVCDQFVHHFTRLRLSAGQISGDEGGGGQLVMDELDRRGWYLNRWNNGAAAKDEEHFQDSKAEVWYNASQLMDMHNIILPNDFDLRAQIINRKRTKGTKGRLAIETKAEMKERGVPSPDRADACCQAGTLVHTASGQVPIESINIGDMVLTPMGYSPVVKLHRNLSDSLVEISHVAGSLMLTGNHKILTRDGWIRADAIMLTHRIESVYGIEIWNILNSLFTRGENIAFKQAVDIIKTRTGMVSPKDFFTGSSGQNGVALFLKAWWYIIKTRIGRTIESATSNCRLIQSIAETIQPNCSPQIQTIGARCWLDNERHNEPLLNGINPLPEGRGMWSTGRLRQGPDWKNLESLNANIAAIYSSSNHSLRTNSVAQVAGINGKSGISKWKGIASFVQNLSRLINTDRHLIAPSRVRRLQLSKSVPVYNLTLATENVYYANGVLVENCLGAMMPNSGWSAGGNTGFIRAMPMGIAEQRLGW